MLYVTCVRIFFKLEYLIVCVYHIYSSISGHLDYFHLLPGANNAALNIGVQVSEFLLLFLLDMYTEVELVDYVLIVRLILEILPYHFIFPP